MDSNFWAARLSSGSKRYQSAFQSRPEIKWDGFDAETLSGFEETYVGDDIREEHPCPFCSEYFDIVGLCCHIDDEHPAEAKNGVCPVCAMRVGVDMVAHIALEHGSIFKMQRRGKTRKLGSHSAISLLRELREGNLRSFFGNSSSMVSSSNAAPDPLLSSFILPMVEDYESAPLQSSAESMLVKKNTDASILERKVELPPMSIEDQVEKATRCDFVQGLLFSTILDENL